MDAEPTITVSVAVPEGLWRDLLAAIEATGQTLDEAVSEALDEWLG